VRTSATRAAGPPSPPPWRPRPVSLATGDREVAPDPGAAPGGSGRRGAGQRSAGQHSVGQRSIRRLRASLAPPIDLFCAVNLAGYITYASPEFEWTLGYSTDGLAGRRIRDLIHPDDVERVLTAGRELVRTGKEYRTENRWITSDGSERWLQWTGWFDTRTRLIYAASRDVTDRRAREEQAALRRVATLVAKIASPAEVFEAVTVEMRHLLGVDGAMLVRFEESGSSTLMAHSVVAGGPRLPAGTQLPVEEGSIIARLRETGLPVRRDGPEEPPQALASRVRERQLIGAAKAPVIVEGRVWGYAGIAWRQPVPADTEDRMVQFTRLVGTAIANADSRAQLDASRARLAEIATEQAALRQVATLVAEGASPTEVFEAIATEMRQLLGIDIAVLERFEPDGTAAIIATSHEGVSAALEAAHRTHVVTDGNNLASMVRATGRPGRIDNYQDVAGPEAAALRDAGFTGTAGAPLMVGGRLWGMAGVGWRQTAPSDIEFRLTEFAGLLGTAISNADSRAQLDASRERVVAAADQARQRIERDLHDSVQQRLVALTLELRELEAGSPIRDDLVRIGDGMGSILEDLREIVQGIHPPVLRRSGLGPALRTLARRSAIPARLDARVEGRLAEPVEVAAYHVVAETLANAAKHSSANAIEVKVEGRSGTLLLSISDDGVGGADPSLGTGLIGLKDRVEALGGVFSVTSPVGGGTTVRTEIPLRRDRRSSPRPAHLPAFEEGEDGEHPPVVLIGLRQVEFLQNMPYVLLDGSLGDPQAAGDPGVRAAFGHQGQHLLLARTEALQGVVVPRRGDQFLNQGRVDDRPPLDDAVERLDEVVHVGDAVLQQVTAPASGADQVHRLLDLDVGGKHQDGHVGKLRADHPGRLEALGRVAGWHPDVDDGKVGLLFADNGQQAGRVAGLADDGEAGALEKACQGFAEQNVIVGQGNTNSHHWIIFRSHGGDRTGV
jgi:PAS domain S-box-containing protein